LGGRVALRPPRQGQGRWYLWHTRPLAREALQPTSRCDHLRRTPYGGQAREQPGCRPSTGRLAPDCHEMAQAPRRASTPKEHCVLPVTTCQGVSTTKPVNRGNGRRTVFHKDGASSAPRIGSGPVPLASLTTRRIRGRSSILARSRVPKAGCGTSTSHKPKPRSTGYAESLRRGRPFGGLAWMNQTARRLGLAATLRPLGRPRKPKLTPPSILEKEEETK
jgi:hypothetical protein